MYEICRALNLPRGYFFFLEHLFLFVHCHLAVGNATDPVVQGSRRRRNVGDHVTNVYSLVEDPLHLVRGKREEKRGKDLDKSGMYTFEFKMEKKMMIRIFLLIF